MNVELRSLGEIRRVLVDLNVKETILVWRYLGGRPDVGEALGEAIVTTVWSWKVNTGLDVAREAPEDKVTQRR